MTQVESLVNDVDFKTTTSRVEFETMAADLKTHFARPIVNALESSGLEWVRSIWTTMIIPEEAEAEITLSQRETLLR